MTLQGHIKVPQDRVKAVRTALPDHIRLTRAEPGCVRFDVIEDATQPGVFHVSEAFTDRAAFDAHQRRAGQSAWADVTAGIPRFYDINDDDQAGCA